MPVETRDTTHKTRSIAWQGWSIDVPANWNPVRLDGDYDHGSVLLADLHAARLGLRWSRSTGRDDPAGRVDRALRDEVGRLAAAEAEAFVLPHDSVAPARLYCDPSPPGRDVFVGHARRSGRVVQVVHHASVRDTAFRDRMLPTLTDTPADAPHAWRVFDLTLATPAGVRVRWYRFDAGDGSLGLETPAARGVTVVRQVGPASLALSRRPLAAWLRDVPASTRRLYRPIGATTPDGLELIDGRRLDGLVATLVRRRRWAWAWPVERRQVVLAFHDAARDRLLLGRSADAGLLRGVLATAGAGS